MNKIISVNPASKGIVVGKINFSSSKEVQEKVELANNAKKYWKEIGLKKRILLLNPLCRIIKSREKELAELISSEMGKPIKESSSEVNGTIGNIEWFLKNVEKGLEEEVTYEDGKSIHTIIYEPYGTVAVITPWNFPLATPSLGIIPNLLVGNTVVFKPSEVSSCVGKIIEEIFSELELPKGVFSVVYGDGSVGKQLVSNKIDFIWFTGSSAVGKAIYRIAAKKFIRVELELGGSNPGIVFEGVNLEDIVPIIYEGRFGNNGQDCNAIKRLIVHESIFDKLISSLSSYVLTKKVGNPLEKNTELGSLASEKQLDLLKGQLDDALKNGAKVIVGGRHPKDLDGAFFEPTILVGIEKHMKVWKEEVFGPILPVIKFSNEEEAIKLANDSIYGLGARIFTPDNEKAQRVAEQLDVGSVEINKISRWLLSNPFGGYKQSGIGRELGLVGFKELSQLKVISKNK